jgi:hypothetical protein
MIRTVGPAAATRSLIENWVNFRIFDMARCSGFMEVDNANIPRNMQVLPDQRTHSLPAAGPSLGGSISGIRDGASAVNNCTGSALVKS